MLQDKQPPSGAAQDNIFREDGPNDRRLASQIIDALDQGVIFWSKSGHCMMRNRRAFSILEVSDAEWDADPDLPAFLEFVINRGDISTPSVGGLVRLFETGSAFQYEHVLPSGRVVEASVRPMRSGGHIVSHKDVSEQRNAVAALERARADADVAQQRADAILADERTRQREGRHLSNLDDWLQSCQNVAELYQVVAAFMAFVLPATRGQLFIYAPARDVLEQVCAWNETTESPHHITPNCCWALRRGRRYFYHKEVLSFPCDHATKTAGEHAPPNETLCVPIVAHGETVGLLHLSFDGPGTNADVLDAPAFASRCGERISMAIANVRLRDDLQDRSDRDPLTGLFNRRVFDDRLKRALIDASAAQTGLAILSVDADKFKPFNDNHGHDAGDAVLKALAGQFGAIDHPEATACRLGGEEFAIILPKADRTRAGKVAEALRLAVEAMTVTHSGQALPPVTVSIGIAIYPTHGTEEAELLKQSDLALYAAKDAGRNTWKIAEGDGMISFE